MYAWRTAYIHVRNCIFKDATIGLQAGMAAGVKVYNSVFTNLSGQAVYTFWNTGPYLYNVTIDNVTTAAFVGMTPFRMYNTTVSNVATVFDFLSNPAFIGDSVNIWNYTTYFGRAYDTSRFTMDNEMSVNPMFVSPHGDYRLQAGSQLIDAGFDVGLPFVGVAPDIGAYEFEELTLPQQVEVLAESFADMPTETLLGPAEKRQNALDNKLAAVLKMVTDAANTDNEADKARALNGALGKLTGDILQKTDGNHGGNPANDWIADSELKTEIYDYVMSLIEAIEAELATFN